MADAEARKLTDKTLYKYQLLFRRLKTFADAQGLRFLKELDTPILRKFRASWTDSNLTALKNLERLRFFFRFAHDNGWLVENPAEKLANPKVTPSPTLPFSSDEMIRLMAAAAKKIAEAKPRSKDLLRRLRALALLLRYSGLRVGDGVGCAVERLSNGTLRLYTAKTGTHVHCPLPEFVVKELEALPKQSERYWFWTGIGKLGTAVRRWQRRLQTLFKDAGISGGHAHRFRDSFAVGLLLEGVPLERVSILLGHSSTRVTEKHYAPWIRERQEQAEADVRRTWAKDPLALLESEGYAAGTRKH